MPTAIIVAYKTPAELVAVVASLRAQSVPPDEIVVVDNGAADGEPVPDCEALDGVRVVRAATNLGYGAGCNLGRRFASSDELLMLNADVVLSADVIETMLHRMEADARIGVVGPQVISGGKLELSARAFPSFRTGLLGRRSLLTRMLIRARRFPAEFRHMRDGGGRVDWVSGACLMVKTAAFDEVGGFDEDYFMYWEDADLCRRLGAVGWTVQYEPLAVVKHATGASRMSERTVRAFHESAGHFASRHMARHAADRALIGTLLRLRCWVALRIFRRSQRLR